MQSDQSGFFSIAHFTAFHKTYPVSNRQGLA